MMIHDRPYTTGLLSKLEIGLGFQIPICTFPGGGASAPLAHAWRRPCVDGGPVSLCHTDPDILILHSIIMVLNEDSTNRP